MEEARDGRSVEPPASTGPERRIGTVVNGKWHVEALLGVGGMAAVYAARHHNGRRAALKVLHPEFARDPVIRDRFLREGYLGNKIPHPGRVEVFDNDVTDDGADFLVMELLEGETLDARTKRNGGRLPVRDALVVAEQLLDFLAACHGAGIVHRDLKPANIFVTREGAVKALDFGIAQHREAASQVHTRAGTALGTPSYMSPEQARGLGDKLDGRSDLFSVGAILYAILSGSRLHKGRSNDESLILAATQPAPSLARTAPELPAEIIALVDKALAWDRRNRHGDAQEMRGEILRLLGRDGEVAQEAVIDVAVEHVAPVPQEDTRGPQIDEAELARLRTLLRHLDRLLPAVRQYGWAHAETERRLRAFFEAIVDELAQRRDGTLSCDVQPYAFARSGAAIWEPIAPLDAIPYALFEAGIRALRLEAGITEPEVRALIEVMLTDPARDLVPEDDLATLLWERGLRHVHAVLESSFAEGTFAEREAFHAESDEIAQLAREAARKARESAELEARAMALGVQRDEGAGPLSREPQAWSIVDSTTKKALAAQLVVATERWTERYVDALVDAFVETDRAGDSALVLEPLRASSADLVVARRTDLVLELHRAAVDVLAMRGRPDDLARLTTELGRALLGGGVFELLVHALRTTSREERGPLLTALSLAAPSIGDEEMPAALDLLLHLDDANAEPDDEARKLASAVEERLARAGAGHERLIAGRLSHDQLGAARRLLGILVRLGTPLSREVVDAVVAGPDLALRIEAMVARSAGGAAFAAELSKMVEHEREEVRLAALRATARNHLREIGPILVRRIQDASFHALSEVERRELLSTLYALHPTRAEAIAIELLDQRSMIRAEARDQSRIAAARMLGRHAATAESLEAVRRARTAWFGASDALKSALDDAARAIEARMREVRA